MQATLPHLPRRIAAIVQVLQATAARCGEIVQLRTRDVDMSGTVWVFRPAQHKAAHLGRLSEIDLGKAAQAVLRPWVKLDPDAYWLDPREEVAEPMQERSTSRKTPRWSPHQVRHTDRRLLRSSSAHEAVRDWAVAVLLAAQTAATLIEAAAATAYALADNRTSELAEWDDAKPSAELAKLADDPELQAAMRVRRGCGRPCALQARPGVRVDGGPHRRAELAGDAHSRYGGQDGVPPVCRPLPDQAAVELLAERLGIKVTERTRAFWFPPVEIETYAEPRVPRRR